MDKLKKFSEKFSQEALLGRFRQAVKMNTEGMHEQVLMDLVDNLIQWTRNKFFEEGREAVLEETKFISQEFDYGTNIGLAIKTEGKKVFPPTVGRYIASLNRVFKEQIRKIRYQEAEIGAMRDEITAIEKKILEIHEKAKDETKELIETKFGYLFGAEYEND